MSDLNGKKVAVLVETDMFQVKSSIDAIPLQNMVQNRVYDIHLGQFQRTTVSNIYL